MAVDVKRVIQELVVPDLQEIKSRLKTVEVEIKRLDEKTDSLKEDVRNLRGDLHGQIESVKGDMRNLRDEFRLAIDIHERLAALEAKIGR